jgi:hypothetical protein
MSKLIYHLKLVEEHLKCAYPEIYDQLMNQLDIDLAPVFTTTIATIFLADLQSVSPETVSHIFDVFLSDGESVIFTLITKFIQMKEKKILETDDFELILYMKQDLPKECMTEKTMPELLDYKCSRSSNGKKCSLKQPHKVSSLTDPR